MQPVTPAPRSPAEIELSRLPAALSGWTAIMIVMGAVIGSGIFLKPSTIAQATHGNLPLILALWIICGLVNLCGALTLAELAAAMPQAGGTYVYLREAYGRRWAFLWGWSEFWVIRSGSIAALAAGLCISLRQLVHRGWEYQLQPWEEACVAIGMIVVLGVINALGVRWGGWVQTLTTVVKVGFVGLLCVLPFAVLGSDRVPIHSEPILWTDSAFWLGLGTALSAIMWAYDGWGNVGVVAEEIRDPQRNIPWALGMGVLLLVVLYTAVNLAYHLTLPWQEIAKEFVPAIAVTEKLLPRIGEPLMHVMLMISVFGALNANVLVGPRVLFAMARDGVFWKPFGYIHPRFQTPSVAILGLTIWSALLIPASLWFVSWQPLLLEWKILSAPLVTQHKQLFDVLTDYCVFGGSIFYLSAVLAVFVLRRTQPDRPRPYRTWGYPVVPAIFVAAYVFLLASMFYSNRGESLAGLLLIASGFGAWWLFGLARKTS